MTTRGKHQTFVFVLETGNSKQKQELKLTVLHWSSSTGELRITCRGSKARKPTFVWHATFEHRCRTLTYKDCLEHHLIEIGLSSTCHHSEPGSEEPVGNRNTWAHPASMLDNRFEDKRWTKLVTNKDTTYHAHTQPAQIACQHLGEPNTSLIFRRKIKTEFGIKSNRHLSNCYNMSKTTSGQEQCFNW